MATPPNSPKINVILGDNAAFCSGIFLIVFHYPERLRAESLAFIINFNNVVFHFIVWVLYHIDIKKSRGIVYI